MNRLSDQITNTLDSNKTFSHLDTIIKELIENAIDAGCRSISIKLLKYGLELIEVSDDGTGMSYETLSGLGGRFTSTKINDYKDLSSLGTFGFRGEALSILSYISTLFIYTRQKNENIGHLAVFKNGALDPKTPIKQVNCNFGTVIQVKNIFYNNPIRLNHFEKNKIEELNSIINTCSKLAFHFIYIGFKLCCEDVKNGIFVTVPANKNESPLEVRRKLAVKLFSINLSDGFDVFNEKYGENNSGDGNENKNSENEKNERNTVNISIQNIKNQISKDFRFECYHTKPSSYIPKSKLILFINDRLVTNSQLFRSFSDVYGKFLIKKGNFFVYLSMYVPSDLIDVNVKANKGEVLLRDEDLLWEHLGQVLEEALKKEINTKNLYASEFKGFSTGKKENKKEELYNDNIEKKTVYAKDKVRVDNRTFSIERYLSLNKVGSKSKGLPKDESSDNGTNGEINSMKIDALKNIIKSNEVYIENAILKEIYMALYYPSYPQLNMNENLTRLFKHGTYIGLEATEMVVFLQYETGLFAVNARRLLDEFTIFKLLIGESDTVKIGGSFSDLEGVFKFVKDRFPSKKTASNVDTMLKDIEKIKGEVLPKIAKIIQPLMEFKDNNISSIKVVNLYDNDKFINYFVNFIPLIYYSLIEKVYFNTTEDQNNSPHSLNLILAFTKILSFYISEAYICYLVYAYGNIDNNVNTSKDINNNNNSHANEDYYNIFFRDMILCEISRDKRFFIRNNVNEDEICEKITDTQRLYTVFERC